ncbi:hypothetical protein EON65_08695 [archaeon]|nr:MAG: hypothetical protein EON65_08695 [archaeon]
MDRKGELKELENLQISTADSGCENSSHTHPISDGVQLSTKLAASSVDIEVSTVSVDSWSEAPSPSICTTAASTNQLHFSFVTHMVSLQSDY